MSMATLLPRPGAFSMEYNFTCAWDKKAPLTDQQHAAISALSHALAGRPFPPNLHCRLCSTRVDLVTSEKELAIKYGGTEKESALEEEAAAMDAVLVNTHQFYKWFAQLESAMKFETNEKYRLYEITLQEHVNTCDGILRQVDDTLNLFEEVQSLHSTVAIKTQTLRDPCHQLLVDKQRLIGFAEALGSHPSEIQQPT